jgi:hypothetical protein
MVIPTKENTSLISSMGVVYSSGMMDESTMECLTKTTNMEGYVFAWYYSLFGPFKKKDQDASKLEILARAWSVLVVCFLTCHVCSCSFVFNVVPICLFFNFLVVGSLLVAQW